MSELPLQEALELARADARLIANHCERMEEQNPEHFDLAETNRLNAAVVRLHVLLDRLLAATPSS